jgi:hypothetical protein
MEDRERGQMEHFSTTPFSSTFLLGSGRHNDHQMPRSSLDTIETDRLKPWIESLTSRKLYQSKAYSFANADLSNISA